jgi:hypothetical protein
MFTIYIFKFTYTFGNSWLEAGVCYILADKNFTTISHIYNGFPCFYISKAYSDIYNRFPGSDLIFMILGKQSTVNLFPCNYINLILN